MKEYWIFTFGSDQLYEGKAVKIAGNWRMARAKMCEKYGDNWAFQYSEEEWDEMSDFPGREEIMEVIE